MRGQARAGSSSYPCGRYRRWRSVTSWQMVCVKVTGCWRSAAAAREGRAAVHRHQRTTWLMTIPSFAASTAPGESGVRSRQKERNSKPRTHGSSTRVAILDQGETWMMPPGPEEVDTVPGSIARFCQGRRPPRARCQRREMLLPSIAVRPRGTPKTIEAVARWREVRKAQTSRDRRQGGRRTDSEPYEASQEPVPERTEMWEWVPHDA